MLSRLAWCVPSPPSPPSRCSAPARVDEQRAPIESIRARGSLSLAVVLDTSRSVRWDRDALGEQLLVLYEALKPGDRLRLSTVGGRAFDTPFRAGQSKR